MTRSLKVTSNDSCNMTITSSIGFTKTTMRCSNTNLSHLLSLASWLPGGSRRTLYKCRREVVSIPRPRRNMSRISLVSLCTLYDWERKIEVIKYEEATRESMGMPVEITRHYPEFLPIDGSSVQGKSHARCRMHRPRMP